jgi:AcrR family transcriptional regulator
VTTAPVRQARRFDPERKSRIVDATIGVIAEHGVTGTTHRRIAAAANVPLGSLTYHFTGLEDLLAQAFQRHSERMSPLYEAHFEGVGSRAEFIDAVTDLIHGDAGATSCISRRCGIRRCGRSRSRGCAAVAPCSNATSARSPRAASTPSSKAWSCT